jgi:hypothetical protein
MKWRPLPLSACLTTRSLLAKQGAYSNIAFLEDYRLTTKAKDKLRSHLRSSDAPTSILSKIAKPQERVRGTRVVTGF